uniref:ATP synthase F0 subunit 8 n=1 Tax=Alpheus randalli TaxID=622420 RepID=A0A5J6UPK2_9EUCA|nr:ATP synthase F0 subunit 8 [Alpheus randalli]
MPQMSPILWLNLYFMFSITLIVFIAMFFFTKPLTQAPQSTKTHYNQKLTWSW